ncbi:putative metallo-hydrolase [Clostridium tepidiprofundi DSM 19306]|uniref:Putative metallo-hydrolase n=1 Tax=Clostridium tepidiprofundi DSM 19306 TaxID=1121338 RepID=A0A151B7C3_9CLOT|nr:MBL fold metallo-hydrolase [Clostridium tepidiprofundi]KYH35547.1 putative metallo-hydrolase [Clostridium tepidiprofundi DSM 19306]
MGKYIYNSSKIKIIRIMSGNSPLLISSKGCNILVDTGIKKRWETITRNIDKFLKNGKLNALILTHAHYDHVENVAAIKEKYNPLVIIHEKEAKYLIAGISSPLLECGHSTGAKINKCKKAKHFFTSINPDILIEDSFDLAQYGIDGKIISTPGHSIGSISIIIDDVGIIGDALGGMTKKPFAKSMNIASQETENSWLKLIDLNCNKYIPSHGNTEYSNDDLKKMYVDYKEIIEIY